MKALEVTILLMLMMLSGMAFGTAVAYRLGPQASYEPTPLAMRRNDYGGQPHWFDNRGTAVEALTTQDVDVTYDYIHWVHKIGPICYRDRD